MSNGFIYNNPAPTVSSISPSSGPLGGGTSVTITGNGFLSGATVTFGGAGATGVTVVSSTAITATTPAHTAGAVNVVVTNTDTQSGTLTNGYTYNTAPSVTAISPTSGPVGGGTTVTITGTGFIAGATVTLGGAAATSVTVVSSTSITATTPPHAAGAVNVVVTNSDNQSGTLTNGFTYNPPPTVTAISPASGSTAGGTTVTITGTGFRSGATLTLGGSAATGVSVISSTSITATTPAHAAGAVNVVVTNSDNQSGTLTNGFTYNAAPTVTAISPTSGAVGGGTSITITGNGFLAGATVTLGGTVATGVTVVSSTSITATTPSHAAGAVNVVVTNTDSQSGTLANGFTYNSAPTVTAISPVSGPVAGGTSVTITGTGFQAGATVTLGGTAATNITVVSSFTYIPPPTVTVIAPASGPITGGTAVTITGAGFRSGATVTVGGNTATSITVVSSTSITAATPAHAAGTVDVVVTNNDNQSGALTNGFTYIPPPAIASISPSQGAIGGGTLVTISGSGFRVGAVVALGGTAATNVSVTSATSITATTPAHTAGQVNVVVTNADGQFGTLTNGFTYNPGPTVTTISPASGPISGGTLVTITGTGFLSGALVTIGGVAATNISVVSGTSITATSPAHFSGSVDVVVTNPGGGSGALLMGFTFTIFEDDFSKLILDTTKWSRTLFSSTQNTSIAVGNSNGGLLIGPLLQKMAGNNYNGISSLSTFDFTGTYGFVQIVQAASASTQAQAQMTAGSSIKNWYRIEVQGNTLKCVKSIGQVVTTLFTTPYNLNNHQFLRIRHDSASGKVVFETAPNNAGLPGNWSQQYSETWDTSVILGTITFEIKAGTFQSEVSPGSVTFDNFRVAKP
ncbi:MAG: IPT/TIG domain-containing protein [Acidobacteria bacterium]|nr:IPT/TIG domain-containing protein [Acidobacteriota bacterium]